MDERDSNLPLIVGAAVALIVHAAIVPVALVGFMSPAERAAVRSPKLDRPMPDSDALAIGQEESSVSSVAWISHEDYRKLIAPQASTEQPALQQQVDPTDQAPMILDATPPGATSAQAQAQPPAQPTPQATPPAPAAKVQQVLITAPTTDQGTLAKGELAQNVEEGAAVKPDEPRPTATQQPTEASAAATASSARPTSASKSDSESPPTQLRPVSLDLRQGAVLTPEGIKLEPTHPRISAVTRASTLPGRNPVATLTFDPDGVVREVELTTSTGAGNWDGPIEASLYQWKASGKKLAQMHRPFTVEVTLLFYKNDR